MKNRKPAVRMRSTWGQPSRGTSVARSTCLYQSARARSKTWRYRASLDGKWCRRLGRRMPTPAAMSFSDVPS
jgi:hypothetical protein